MRNQTYHCAIDRQIIRQPGPRPPSPTSKIRTTAEREEESKKNARENRARRRKGMEEEEIPVVERLVRLRCPGDEDDYEEPVRPSKRAKPDEKYVKWDTNLTIIRDNGSIVSSHGRAHEGPATKGCLRVKDSHKPVENLKRTRVVVTAVFYEGEEPVPTPSEDGKAKKR
ncbi:hypothetical protein IAU60_006621 [Kwoniella sp. DSM 27419]